MIDNYLTVGAIFRDEAPYLAEWISFHRLVGVDHFILYDNESSDNPERVLQPFISAGLVTLVPWPVPFHQKAPHQAYADCLDRVRGKSRWLTCLDIDEFLFAPQQPTLPPVLREFEFAAGVVVRWQVYGSSGHQHPLNEPVISRFVRRAPTNWIRNRRTKSIVDPTRTLAPVSAHHFAFQDGVLAVDETKQPIGLRPGRRFKKRLRPLYRMLGPVLRYFDPYARTDITSRIVSVNCLRINHYPIKSRAEFEHKARFKKKKKRYDGVDYFAYHDRNEVHDPILCRYMPALNDFAAQVASEAEAGQHEQL
ncbi:MAG: glycosyltransferase family 92 protein [Planctomycetaceae bacterium]